MAVQLQIGVRMLTYFKNALNRLMSVGPLLLYRVSGLSCPEEGGCKSAILRGSPDVFSLFGPCKVGEISFRYSWTTWMKKQYRNLIHKKRSDFRVCSN